MDNSNQDILADEILLETQDEMDEIDFASLLDLSNPLQFLAQKNKISEGEKYVVFHLDEKQYAINSKDVAEVTPSLPITTLPNVPDWFLGIANLRGEIISVVDLRKLWKKETTPPAKTRLIVFHSAKHETSIAFVVDKLNEIVTLSAKDINFSAADFEDSFPTFFGRSEFKSQPLFLLDVDNILSSLSLADLKTV